MFVYNEVLYGKSFWYSFYVKRIPRKAPLKISGVHPYVCQGVLNLSEEDRTHFITYPHFHLTKKLRILIIIIIVIQNDETDEKY